MQDKPVTLAAVTGAHGVAGEVRLKLFGGGLEGLTPNKRFNVGGSGTTLTLSKVRSDNKGGAIAGFAEIDGRNAAEALRGTVLTIPRSDLPALDEGEFYYSDLLGLPVVTDAGDEVGRVCAVENFGATEIVEIEKPDGQKFMVPLTEQAVPNWDRDKLTVSADFVD